MDVDASYSRDEYGRARIRGNSEFGHFDVNASLLMEDIMFGPEFGGYSASAVLTGLDVNRIFDKFSINFPIPMIGADVQFNAEGTARGNADSVVFEIPAAIDVSAKLRGTHHIDDYVGLNAAIRNGNWILDGSWGLNRVEGRGSLNWTNGAVKGAVNADMPDPSAFVMTFTGERASGRVAAGAEFGMRIDRPEKIAFTADLKGNDIVWRGMLADSIEARISFENGNLHLFDASGYVSGRVDSVMKYFGHDSADGRLEVDFSMRGNFDDLFLNAYIRAWNLHYGQHFLDTLAGFASLESDTLRWSSLYLRGGEGTSMRSIGSLVLRPHLDLITTADLFDEQNNAAGTLSFSGTIKDDVIRAECQAVSVPLALLDPWVPDEHRMTGSVTLTGEFSGTTANPAARVSFRFANPNHSGYTAYSLIGDAVLSDSLVSSAALFRLSSNAEPIELRTRLPFLPSSGWALDETGTRAAFAIAQANDFDISDIVAYFDEQLADWRAVGNASFNVEITNAGDGWNVGGALMIPNGRMRYVPENLNVAGIKLDADFSGTLLEPNVDFTVTTGIAWTDLFRLNRGFIRGRSGLDALEIDSARFVFRNDGVIDISQARLFYIEADSLSDVSIFSAQCSITNLPAAVFSRLVPGIEIQSGTFNGGGAVSVNNGRPLAEGALLLSGLNFALTDINPPIGPIDAGIQLRDSTIQITWVSGGWGARGYLSAHGETHWDTEKFYNMDVRVSGTNLSFELPEVIYVGISDADLRINDRPDGFIVSGRAALGPIPTSYVRDINIIEMIGQTQIGSGIRRAPDPFMESIRLHIDLDLADRMGIDMNLGVLTMDGRVTVSGTAAEPGIVGRVAISEGYVYYIDRKFDIMEGTLFNPDVAAFNPDIRIVATSDVSTFSPTAISEQFLITLTMTGTLEDPVVRFTSDPPLSELDILSILTFGERLGGMGSDLNTRLANIAVQQAIGIGTRRLEKLLNVDRISVTGDVIGAGGPEGDGVTIGTAKRFTDRLNIIYEINTGDQINQKATAQYRLLRNIYLEGQTTGMGENAVSLTFRYSR
ncbi:MAG: translocation/assembly module TamB, partial [Chitinispirillales bacterium]|jgi:hypothetical protein|nr:translocation/assembly module TamB [Chitinispirillales bacterium]